VRKVSPHHLTPNIPQVQIERAEKKLRRKRALSFYGFGILAFTF